ncbi:hypothetical protein TNCT_430331 [Trichonephila clavata]|uniref:Uncharacterized protein n=1 Tax=Trichonephila clavata TaxID=2740835 RepID=A0A8X6H3M4_TRICU|nr:hypothetical protein TNCT_430331 [Trichonephila clavata]
MYTLLSMPPLSHHLELLVIPIGRTWQGRQPIPTTPRTREHRMPVQDLKAQISHSLSSSHFSAKPEAARRTDLKRGRIIHLWPSTSYCDLLTNIRLITGLENQLIKYARKIL